MFIQVSIMLQELMCLKYHISISISTFRIKYELCSSDCKIIFYGCIILILHQFLKVLNRGSCKCYAFLNCSRVESTYSLIYPFEIVIMSSVCTY